MPPPGNKRIQYIDLLRGWAVIVMIQTHVFNAALRPEITATAAFQWLKFVDGLVAPSFLFASGLAFAVTARRKLKGYLSFGRPLFRQLGRLLFILLLGYALHLPAFRYGRLVRETGPEEWQIFFQADILHCIAASLLFLQGLLLLLRGERWVCRVLYGATAVVILVTPVMWGSDFPRLFPAAIAAYVNGRQHSLFPLFPWAAFLFAGAITGYHYAEARQGEPAGAEREMMRHAALAGLVALAASFVLEPLARSIYRVYDYWLFSPSFVLLRLGLVLLLCYGMFIYEKAKGVSRLSPVTLIGSESLIVYVAHLMLLYGNHGGRTFQEAAGSTLGWWEASLTALVLVVLMYALAWVWHRIKRGPPRLKLAVELGTLVAFAGAFFLPLP
jgi:uncharacterized membrane protein